MKLLIDTNVVLDVLLNRMPFSEDSAKVLRLAAEDEIEEYVSASAVTDIYYIIRRSLKDANAARELLKKLLSILSVAAVTEEDIRKAVELGWTDFEDCVQYSAAVNSQLDLIITRNPADYRDSKLPVMTPAGFLKNREMPA